MTILMEDYLSSCTPIEVCTPPPGSPVYFRRVDKGELEKGRCAQLAYLDKMKRTEVVVVSESGNHVLFPVDLLDWKEAEEHADA